MSQLIPILTLQGLACIISLSGILIVIAALILLMATSAKSENESSISHREDKIISSRYFIALIVIFVISFASSQYLPYPRIQAEADEVVTVVGIQWDWQMAHGVTNKTPHQFLGKNEISLPVNKKIKFIVMSDDVTHNFGIYNSRGVLLTQIQAMPQYRNELHYTFNQKGKYTILCLEYCGLVHGFMTGTIHVN